MINSELLEKHIKESGYKKNFIAEKLGITPYAFSLKICGINEFKGSEIKMLMTLLKLNFADTQKIFLTNSDT